MYFRAGFHIQATHDAGADHTLTQLRDTTLRTLAVTLIEGSEEWGDGPAGSFWELVVERPTLDSTGDTVRLEIRAHKTPEQDARAEIVTRYGRTAAPNPAPELPTFPPKLLEHLARNFRCLSGTTHIRPRARHVRENSARALVDQTLLHPDRNLPVLIVTRRPDGRTPRNPNTLQTRLLGVAEVIILEGGSTHTVRKALGRATYGGAIRIVETGAQPESSYYHEPPDPRMLIRTCLSLASPDGFDAAHAAVRNQANQEQAACLTEDRPAQNATSERAQTPPFPSERLQPPSAPLQLAQTGTDAVTLLNHAVNICRDPLRRYAISRMRSAYGKRIGEKILTLRNRRIRNVKAIRAQPENAIDINDLPDIVSTFDEAFRMDPKDRSELARILREVKQTRNLAAHPPLNGLTRSQVVDKISVLEHALRHIDQNSTADEVAQLGHLHHKAQPAQTSH